MSYQKLLLLNEKCIQKYGEKNNSFTASSMNNYHFIAMYLFQVIVLNYPLMDCGKIFVETRSLYILLFILFCLESYDTIYSFFLRTLSKSRKLNLNYLF